MLKCTNHPDVPAVAVCRRCERPLCNDCLRQFSGKVFCRDCAEELERRQEERDILKARNLPLTAPQPPAEEGGTSTGRGLALAASAGLLAALLWYLSVVWTHSKLGLVAIVVGWIVGRAAVLGAGDEPAPWLPLLSLGAAVAAMLLGEYLILNHLLGDGGGPYLSLAQFLAVYAATLHPLDLLFFALGAYAAYRLPAAALA